MGLLVAAEIMITKTVLRDGPFTALGQLVYLDALSAFILFIIGAVGLACSFYMRSYMDEQVARGVIATGECWSAGTGCAVVGNGQDADAD